LTLSFLKTELSKSRVEAAFSTAGTETILADIADPALEGRERALRAFNGEEEEEVKNPRLKTEG